jgi:hypothetical protein
MAKATLAPTCSSWWTAARTQEGSTALHAASSGGHVAVMRELLRAGACPTALNQVRCKVPGARQCAYRPRAPSTGILYMMDGAAGLRGMASCACARCPVAVLDGMGLKSINSS